MSKFRVVEGSNVTSIAARNREIRQLEREIQHKDFLTNKDCLVFAYHFVRLEHPILAQKYLNKLQLDYFEVGIYKDLYQALLGWSITHATQIKNEKFERAYEYFLIVKRSLDTFDKLSFEAKPAFLKFKKEFTEYSLFINLTIS